MFYDVEVWGGPGSLCDSRVCKVFLFDGLKGKKKQKWWPCNHDKDVQ